MYSQTGMSTSEKILYALFEFDSFGTTIISLMHVRINKNVIHRKYAGLHLDQASRPIIRLIDSVIFSKIEIIAYCEEQGGLGHG